MFDIGFFELLIIAVVGLVVLGPERLPGAIRSTMKTVRSIKGMANGFRQEVEQQFTIHELHENLK
jgi:sec-independent protein translocase protein TatB